MKTVLATALALAAVPAMAHDGAHMHPHGLESVWLYALVALVASAVTSLAVRARR